VPIDWKNGKTKLKLRNALIAVYPDTLDLEMFVADELNGNLEVIANEGNLNKDVFKLVKWAESKGLLDKLFHAFCQCNEDNPSVIDLERQLNKGSFTPVQSTKLSESDWEILFKSFTEQNVLEVCRAFSDAYKSRFGHSFLKASPDTSLKELSSVFDLLERFDDPLLSVRFVDRAITKLEESDEATPEQLNILGTWRDRIAAANNILPEEPEPLVEKQGYLLVAIEESGKRTKADGAFVSVFSELHVIGEPEPVEFGGTSETCPLNKVAEHVSKLIHKAEQVIERQITLEIFLPCAHLQEDVADWEVLNEQNSPRPLWTHRGFIVRSFERVKNRTTQACVMSSWNLLKTCIEANTVCENFHLQDSWPGKGHLVGHLNNAPGLKLSAELSAEPSEQLEILFDIINSGVPIALWFDQASSFTATEKQAAFDVLLRASCLTDFSQLAQQRRTLRLQPENAEWRHLKLLCDCPGRWPRLPDQNQAEDLLVAL
jgi:hypothetical protein